MLRCSIDVTQSNIRALADKWHNAGKMDLDACRFEKLKLVVVLLELCTPLDGKFQKYRDELLRATEAGITRECRFMLRHDSFKRRG